MAIPNTLFHATLVEELPHIDREMDAGPAATDSGAPKPSPYR